MAARHFAAVAADATAEQSTKDMNAALLASAEGDWDQASSILADILAKDADNFVVSLSTRSTGYRDLTQNDRLSIIYPSLFLVKGR